MTSVLLTFITFVFLYHQMVLAAALITPHPRQKAARQKAKGQCQLNRSCPFYQESKSTSGATRKAEKAGKQDCRERLRPILIYHLGLTVLSAKNPVGIELLRSLLKLQATCLKEAEAIQMGEGDGDTPSC